MINKLKKRIFWIIQGLLTSIIVIIVGLYVVTGYKDSVKDSGRSVKEKRCNVVQKKEQGV